jgi:hypothetical protein
VKWLAVLLSLASLGGNPAPGEVKQRKHCAKAKVTKQCKAPKPKKKKTTATKPAPSTPAAPRSEDAPRAPDAPAAAPAPGAAPPAPTATAQPTVTPSPYPSRTNVDLDEWFVRPSYRAFAAGPIEFNVNNRGEDDHDFSVRGGGREYGRIDLAPGETDSLTVTLAVGSYTLYCSLPDHEAAGMGVNISVR